MARERALPVRMSLIVDWKRQTDEAARDLERLSQSGQRAGQDTERALDSAGRQVEALGSQVGQTTDGMGDLSGEISIAGDTARVAANDFDLGASAANDFGGEIAISGEMSAHAADQIDHVAVSASAMDDALADAGDAATGMGKATASATAEAKTGLAGVLASVKENKEHFSALGVGATAFGAAVTGVAGGILALGISYNQLRQRSVAALTALTGSAEEANAQMDRMDEFASTSPFARDVFIRAQQQMMAFGIAAEDVVPWLDRIQNTVAATGGSNQDIAELANIVARIGSVGKISANDLNELGYRGVNAAKLIGDQMGMTEAQIRDSITRGTLDARQALDALGAGMEQTYGGAAALVKETLDGAVDRVKAAIRDIGAGFASVLVSPDGGGMLLDFLNNLANALRWFESLPEPIKQTVFWLGTAMGAVSLFAGATLLAVPKVAAFTTALQTMGGPVAGATLRGLGGLRSFLLGPWGLALGAAVTGIGFWVNSQADAAAKSREWKDALDATTGALTAQNTEILKSQLGDEYIRIASAAKELGVAEADLILAMSGDKAARDRVVDSLQAHADALASVHEGSTAGEIVMSNLTDKTYDQGTALNWLIGAIDSEYEARSALNAEKADQIALDGEVAAAAEATAEATEKVASSFDELANAMSGLGSSMSEGFSAAGEAVIAEADRIVEDGLSALRVEYGSLVVATAESSAAIVDWGTALSEARAKTDSGTGSLRLFVDELLRMQKAQLNFEDNLDLVLANFGPEVARKVREQDPQVAQWMADDIRDNKGLITAEAADVYAETSALGRQEAADTTLRMEALWRAAYATVGAEGAKEMGQRLYDGSITALEAIEEYDLKPELEVLVDANDAAALAVLDELAAHELEVELQLATESAAARADAEAERIRNLDPVVDMYGNIDPLAISAQAEVDRITALDPVVDMYGNIDPLLLEGDRVVAQIERYDPVVDMYGNIDPLASAANAEAGRISDLNPTMNISANTSWAVTAANNLRSQISGMVATIGIAGAQRVAFATGGPVVGPGTGTSDSIPAMLSNGEYVLRAATVQAAGGFAQVNRLVSLIESKGVRGYALGGPVQPNYARYTPPPAPVVVQQAAGGGGSGPRVAQYITVNNPVHEPATRSAQKSHQHFAAEGSV